ncbi:MAG TPA: nuclear transport factor 2 family protein [Chthoniobacterales bacterium]|nr:nuclear transport factor 2 family protein [Chthoniobacterales bacterium]
MADPKYTAWRALDPFFNIVQQGLADLVDGGHYFETIAEDAVFEFRYIFPGWPLRVDGREALMTLYAGYGDNIVLHGAGALIAHRTQDPRIVILEYEVHGKTVRRGASYDNRFISVVTIQDRKIVHWRDYMDSLAAMTALST